MSATKRLEARLQGAREFTEQLLSKFNTPEEWTHQVHPKANHALWFAGHMGFADNFFVSLVDPGKAVEKEGYGETFGMGSQPTNNPDDYPSVEDVLAFMRNRREALLGVLADLSDDDLAKPTPEGAPDFLSDVASIFEMAVWHEGIHAGQATVAHRSLGNAPMFGAPEAAESNA